VRLKDIYNWVQLDTGIKYIMTGAKKADGLWRRRHIGNTERSENFKHIINPIKEWNKYDVFAYLKANNIPLPLVTTVGNAGGVGIATDSLLNLYDNHREDFEKMKTVFPFVEAVVYRRKFYGVGYTKTKERKEKPSKNNQAPIRPA
jgi:3'-phosphoadenosine 5'-phosphosulfate sulfotransferase (PAPS reductase)/FAD synthetase